MLLVVKAPPHSEVYTGRAKKKKCPMKKLLLFKDFPQILFPKYTLFGQSFIIKCILFHQV